MSFKLISDVTQVIKPELFGPNWYCLGVASIPLSNISSERFFFLLLDSNPGRKGTTYIEEYVDAPLFFIKIKDQSLWNDLFKFFYDKGLITIEKGKEIKVGGPKK